MDITLPSANLEASLANPLVLGILDTCSDGAVVISAESRRIVAINRRARELLGHLGEDVRGHRCRDVLNSEACRSDCMFTALLEGRKEAVLDRLVYDGKSGGRRLVANPRVIVIRGPDQVPIAAIEMFQDLSEFHQLETALHGRRALDGIVGHSPPMQELYRLVEQVAPYAIHVLLTGESGVGKERFSDAVQFRSMRKDGSYVKVNCAALNPSLIESELFGHRRGAFTGAISDRRGSFEEAHNGTLLLDEVGELPASLQAKLLRAIQQGEIQRVGEDRPRKVDVRVIASTNHDIEDDVGAGRFRSDLYYRLAGVRLHIPPLRDRAADIPLLAEHFLVRFSEEAAREGRPKPLARLSHAAIDALLQRDWPGNVRELENVLRLAFIRVPPGREIEVEHLAEARRMGRATPLQTLAELERQAIQRAMDSSAGNMSAAARILGVDRTTLWRKLKREGLL